MAVKHYAKPLDRKLAVATLEALSMVINPSDVSKEIQDFDTYVHQAVAEAKMRRGSIERQIGLKLK